MPSHLHEVLIEMFRDRPALAADLLRGALGIAVPEFRDARLSAGDLTDVAPTEYRADAVVTFGLGNDPVFAVVVEVQLSIDARKRYAWPAYVATLHARLRCPVMLLVLCSDPAVAVWSARPIVVSNPGLWLTPVVLGPQEVPKVTDVAVARRQPELTVLSTLAHGGQEDSSAVFEALFAALNVIDHDHANLYTDLVFAMMPAAARVWMEEFMTTAAELLKRDFPGRYVTRFEREGLAKGLEEGLAEGEAKALLTVLDARGIHVPDDIRADITACTDTAKLDEWIRRAATAEKIQDVVNE
jgi:hypothetical protein